MHYWFKVMAHKPWITAKFVTVCCSMSMVSNTSCSNFFGQWSYWSYTHAFTKLHTEVMSWISCAYECQLCMDLLNTVLHDLYCPWAACPCLSWSTVAMHALTWVVFVPRASFMPTLHSGSSPNCMHKLPGLHEIFKYAHLKFMVYGHTNSSHASVGLSQARPNNVYTHVLSGLRLISWHEKTK